MMMVVKRKLVGWLVSAECGCSLGRHGRGDNCLLANTLSVFVSQYFGLCTPTVRSSLVVIRGVVGRGGGIRNCITQPSKVTNIINSLGDSPSLELRDQPSCLACMTFRYTGGFC
jgi:hypothetical protein